MQISQNWLVTWASEMIILDAITTAEAYIDSDAFAAGKSIIGALTNNSLA